MGANPCTVIGELNRDPGFLAEWKPANDNPSYIPEIFNIGDGACQYGPYLFKYNVILEDNSFIEDRTNDETGEEECRCKIDVTTTLYETTCFDGLIMTEGTVIDFDHFIEYSDWKEK